VEGVDGADLRPSLFRCCTSHGWEVYEVAAERISLEEAFRILASPEPGRGAKGASP
jgi:hypothetical protein